MSRARELAKAGGVQQRIAGFSSHVGMSTFLAAVHMEDNLTVDGNIGVGGNLTVTGTTTFNGGTLTLGDANTDNVVFGGEVDSNIIPDDDNSFDLGSASKEWKDLYVDGIAYLDKVESDGGSFGNIRVGETGDNEIDTESGNLTLDSAGGTVTVDDNLTVSGNLDIKSSKLTVGTGSTDVIIRGTTEITGELKASSIAMGGSIIPDTDDAYDLGSASKMWRDVYIGPGSLYINGQKVIEENSSNIIVSCDDDQNLVLQTSGSGDLELDPIGSGLVQVKGALQMQDGQNITNSSGNDVTFGNRIGVDAIISKSTDTNLTLSGEGSGKVRVADDLEVTGATSFTGGLTVGTNGVSVTTVNATGISSFTSNLNVSGVFDVDGHTNLDNVSVAGVTTFSTPLANANLANSSVSYGGISLALGASDATPAFDLTDATNYPTSSLSGTITNAQLAGSIANDKLSNSAVSYGGISLSLGGSDATPAFDLTDATNYPTSSLTGTITNTQLAGSIANGKLANSSVSYGGIQLALGASDATPAFDLTDATNYPTSSLTGTITNTQLAGSIANSKLSNSSITIGSDSIALGGSQTDINGLTSLDVDNVTIDGNTVTTSSGNLTIDSNGGTTTIDDNTVISGNLTVNGTTTTINSTTVAIDDKNFQVATGAADDSAANGAGFTVESGDGNKTFNFESAGDNWGASENLNLASGKVYKINNSSILSATTLGSSVVSSSLTSVGTLGSLAVTNNITVGGTVDGRDLATDGSKLDGIEASATADQTAAEIRTLVESASDSNVFTDADHSKLDGIEASATADQTDEEIQDIVGAMLTGNTESGITVTYQDADGTIDFSVASQTDENFTTADHSKLDGIESGATADQTAAEIRTLVESASDSNVFTDADHSKLNGIEASATADQTASEILTLIKTVDGSGSGLDADTLDGISSASFLRSDTSDSMSGTLTMGGNILPDANGTRDLGASGTRWANIYSSDLDLSNQAKGANSVDGTWGSYLIEEGEDHLYLTNRRSGKKFRFMLEEV